MIEFDGVTKLFGTRAVLDDVSFKIEAGETFVIVGLSGAGKSVTLKHMVRLIEPDEGRIWIDGECVSEARGKSLEAIRARFGLLFQSAALMQWMSVTDNVALPLRERMKLQEDEVSKRVAEKLALVNLSEAGGKYPSEISGGMKKRVGLARAIVTHPEIVLYDEPTSGLDPVTSRTIDGLIDNMRTDLGVTNVVVTHDLHSALAIGTRIAMLHNGKIIENSPPEQFIQSKNKIVQSFLEAQYITKAGVWETT